MLFSSSSEKDWEKNRGRFKGIFDADRRGVKFKLDDGSFLPIRARFPNDQVQKILKMYLIFISGRILTSKKLCQKSDQNVLKAKALH